MAEEAEQCGIRSRRRQTKSGSLRGGNVLSRGHIHYILTSPIYAGRIPHKGKIYEGQHQAIIYPERWQRIQDRLRTRSPMPGSQATRKTSVSPLLGKLFDENGARLSPSHSRKRDRRYRYYISRGYVTGRKDSLKGRGWRLPAEPLEQVVAQAIRNYLSGSAMAALVPDAQVETLKRLQGLKNAEQITLIALLSRVKIREDKLSLMLDADALARAIEADPAGLNSDQLSFEVPFTCKRRGVETRFVMAGASKNTDGTLIANIARAHDWLERIKSGEALDEIATAEGTTKKRVQQTVEYAFLTPDIVRDILAGNQPLGLTTTWVATHTIPINWTQQRALISTL